MIPAPVQVSVFSESGGQDAPAGPTIFRTSPVVTDLFRIPSISGASDSNEVGREPVQTGWREALTDLIQTTAENDRVNYAIPGHPLLGDATVQHLLAEDRAGRIELELLADHLPVTLTEILALNGSVPAFVDVLTLLDVSAASPFSAGMWPASTGQSVVISNVILSEHGPFLSSFLVRRYSLDTLVRLAPMVGRPLQFETPLSNISDHQDMPACYLVLPPATGDTFQNSADDLQRLVARLRAPEGCPWDREQTHQSLTRNLIEESYELLSAIESEDVDAMREELGDFILQAWLHCQIAEEANEFTLEDVLGTLIEKLVRRHPHVFAAHTADSPEAVVQTWDAIKKSERDASKKSATRSPFGEVPESLPALLRAQSLLRRAPRNGVRSEEVRDHTERAIDALQSDAERTYAREIVRLVNGSLDAGVDLEMVLRRWTQEFERSNTHPLDSSSTPE